ncbi:Condensin-2 complex subunit G2 [Massospora cicadina]|nr:Condensin-2 complex subunit G2 [Massospora cicadina]
MSTMAEGLPDTTGLKVNRNRIDLELEGYIQGGGNFEPAKLIACTLGDIDLPAGLELLELDRPLRAVFWSRLNHHCGHWVFPPLGRAAAAREAAFHPILEEETCNAQLDFVLHLSNYLAGVMDPSRELDAGVEIQLVRTFQAYLRPVSVLRYQVAEAMFGVVESWMVQDRPAAASLAGPAFSYLLDVAVRGQEMDKGLRRIHTLAKYLLELDLSDANLNPLTKLVEELIRSPTLTSCPTWMDVVLDLLRHSNFKLLPLHRLILSKVKRWFAVGNNEVATLFGESGKVSLAYYARWRDGHEVVRRELGKFSLGGVDASLEQVGLVDLLERELLLPTPLASKIAPEAQGRPDSRAAAKFLQEFWNPFLENRDPDFEAMANRWFRIPHPAQRSGGQRLRYFAWKRANPKVRANAVKLLARFFPLRDPYASIVDQSQAIEDQLALLKVSSRRPVADGGQSAIYDASPLVRATAIEAACYLFTLHWAIFPDGFRSELLLLLVRDLAYDVGSTNCRLAVLAGLGYLFKHCTKSHPTLKVLLPSLAALIHDGRDGVRNLYLDLLLSAHSAYPELQLPETDSLVELLAAASPGVSRRAGALLLEVYFPLTQPLEVRLRRCEELMACGSIPALAFYSNLPGYLAKSSSCREAIAKFVCRLLEGAKPTLLALEIAAALLRGIRPHLKSKACRCLSSVLDAAALASMLDLYSGQPPELSAVFSLLSISPSPDPSLHQKLLGSAGEVLGAVASNPAAASGIFEYLTESRQLDGYVDQLISRAVASLSQRLGTCEGDGPPKKRARRSTVAPGSILTLVDLVAQHPPSLKLLVEHPRFHALLSLLREASERIRAAPELKATPDTQYLLDSTELLYKLWALAADHQAEKVEAEREPLPSEGRSVAKSVLDLAQSLLDHFRARPGSGEVAEAWRDSVGMRALEACLRLAPDMAMVGFLDSELLLAYLGAFVLGSGRCLVGLEAHVLRAKLLDQAVQLMQLYGLGSDDDHPLLELIDAVSQGLEYLFGGILGCGPSSPARRALQNLRPLVHSMAHLTCRRDRWSEFPAMLVGCLMTCENCGDARLAADILVSALDLKLSLEPALTAAMIPPRMNSFCDPLQLRRRLDGLMLAHPTSSFLKRCSEADAALAIQRAQPPPPGEIRGYLCPCGCCRLATVSGDVLYWDPEEAAISDS